MELAKQKETPLKLGKLEKVSKVEATKIEWGQKLEQLKTEQKVAKTRAIMNVYDESEGRKRVSVSNHASR